MCDTVLLNYSWSVQRYESQKQVVLDPYCNGIVVKNAGTSVLIIQGDPLQPNESKSIGGNYAEIFVGRVDVSFVAGVGLVNLAIVTQKFYTNIEQCNKKKIQQ